ncbi:MAG: hypothetical protein U1F35_15950 [Steroidobacteraceae bacterium]
MFPTVARTFDPDKSAAASAALRWRSTEYAFVIGCGNCVARRNGQSGFNDFQRHSDQNPGGVDCRIDERHPHSDIRIGIVSDVRLQNQVKTWEFGCKGLVVADESEKKSA